MIEWLAKLPEVVWAALGGSGLTLLGVWLQNLWEGKRLRQRLQHDEAQRNRERQIQLRRDIYLEAADSAVKAQRILADIARVDRPVAELGGVVAPLDLAGLSKAHLVGQFGTIQAFQELGQSLFTEMLSLLEARAEYEEAKLRSEELNDKAAQLVAHRDQFVAGLRELANRIQLTAPQVADYVQSLAKTQQEVEATLQERVKADKTLLKHQRALVLKGLEAGLNYGRAMAVVGVAVRKELEEAADFDEQAYQRLISGSYEQAKAQWGEFVDRLYDRFGGD